MTDAPRDPMDAALSNLSTAPLPLVVVAMLCGTCRRSDGLSRDVNGHVECAVCGTVHAGFGKIVLMKQTILWRAEELPLPEPIRPAASPTPPDDAADLAAAADGLRALLLAHPTLRGPLPAVLALAVAEAYTHPGSPVTRFTHALTLAMQRLG